MTRDELVQAGVRAILTRYEPVAEPDPQLRRDVATVLDAVEQLIRADEREKTNVYWRQEAARWRQAKDFTPDDARAELEALRAAVDRLRGEKARLIGELLYAKAKEL